MGGAASARRLTGCWLGCVVGAAPCWCCAGRRGSLRRARRGPPAPRPRGRPDTPPSAARDAETAPPHRCPAVRRRPPAPARRHPGSACGPRAPAAPGTAQVLGFVGRRLLAEPVGLVFAARTTTTTTSAAEDPLAGLPDLRLSGLDEPSARALLASVTTGRIDESVRRRIVEEAHGNPLALRELGVVDFAGGFAMPDSVSVPRRIEDQYLTRLRGLPRVTQRLLLVAAADPVGDRVLLARAAHALDLDVGALELAVDAGLLGSGAAVRFRHPLLRSAVYRDADARERRAAHAALAAATDPRQDPDRRAWHRAYAAGAADEEVAAELIGSADRAARRGGAAAAAAFWERAVALTPEPGRRAVRALVAAEAKFAAGDFVAAQKLLAAADIGPLDELGHARVEFMRARIAFKLNRGADAPLLLLHAAQRLQSLDADLERQTLLEALLAAIYVDRKSVV